MKLQILAFVILAGYAAGTAAKTEGLSWHGFAAQGFAQASDTNYIDNDGDPSLALTEVGLNGAYRLSPNLRLAAQGVYLNGGNRYPEGVRLDYLFADWQPVNNLNWQVNMHIGRVKNYHWLYSSTRDVPHTRPTIVLPQSVYFDVFRDVALGIDGLSLLVQNNNSSGDWEFYASYGSAPISHEQTQNLLGKVSTGNLELSWDRKVSVYWQPAESNLKFGVSILNADFSYIQGDSDAYIDGTATSQRFMTNMTYFSENWDLAVELLRERVIYRDFLVAGFLTQATAEGGYVQGRYRINENIKLLTRLDIFDLDSHDRSGKQREALSDGLIPAYFGYQDQATLGMTWDFKENWRFSAEVHRVKGTGRLAPVLLPDTQRNTRKYWNIWAVQVMYWF